MAEVVAIRQGLAVEPPAGSVNPDVVKELQELLDRANCGEITGFAYVTLHPGDLTCHHSIGRITRGVMGALLLLQYALAKSDSEKE